MKKKGKNKNKIKNIFFFFSKSDDKKLPLK